MRRTILIVFLLCLLLPGLCGAESENLLKNASFESITDSQWPLGWEEDMWLYDTGISYLEIAEGGVDGNYCVLIENVSSNDARFVQSVSVEENAYYRLSGWVRAEGCDPLFTGANLSVVGSFADFPSLLDTQGEWMPLVCYLHTGEGQRMIDVAARLGGYSNDTVGRVYFDALELVRVEESEIPLEASLIELGNIGLSAPEEEIAQTVLKEGNVPSSFVILLCIVFCLLFVS